MDRYVWLMKLLQVWGEWRYVLIINGELYVMMIGMFRMLQLFVDNLDCHHYVRIFCVERNVLCVAMPVHLFTVAYAGLPLAKSLSM